MLRVCFHDIVPEYGVPDEIILIQTTALIAVPEANFQGQSIFKHIVEEGAERVSIGIIAAKFDSAFWHGWECTKLCFVMIEITARI